MNRFDAVLFDLDGTLLDTLEDIADAMNAALLEAGFQAHPISSYRTFVGDGVEQLVRRVLPPSGLPDAELIQLAMRMRAEYANRWSVKTRPYDGIETMLATLVQREIPLAILSNKPDDFTQEMVTHYFPGVPFKAIRGAFLGGPVKPDPSSALEISRVMGIAPERFAFLGDTNTDMRTATAAGMHAVGALWGFRDAQELRECGARELVETPQVFLDLLFS